MNNKVVLLEMLITMAVSWDERIQPVCLPRCEHLENTIHAILGPAFWRIVLTEAEYTDSTPIQNYLFSRSLLTSASQVKQKVEQQNRVI